MLLSEFMNFIYDKDKNECNENLQIALHEQQKYINLMLSEEKWEVLKWFRQFLDGDLEMKYIRFTPKETDSLDGEVIKFHGRKYKLLEVD